LVLILHEKYLDLFQNVHQGTEEFSAASSGEDNLSAQALMLSQFPASFAAK
jgi:beta-galactosidase beta subunit